MTNTAGPYPSRRGAALADYRRHIIEVVCWKQARNGAPTWDGDVDEDLGKRGLAAARQLQAEGVIILTTGVRRVPGGMVGNRQFGRSGWVHPYQLQTFIIRPGRNFPEAAP